MTCTLMAGRLAKVLPRTGLFRVALSLCVAGDRKKLSGQKFLHVQPASQLATHRRHPSGRLKHARWGGITPGSCLSWDRSPRNTIHWAGSSKVESPEIWCLVRTHILVHRPSSHCVLTQQREREKASSLCLSFVKGTNPSGGLCPHNRTSSQRPPSPNAIA